MYYGLIDDTSTSSTTHYSIGTLQKPLVDGDSLMLCVQYIRQLGLKLGLLYNIGLSFASELSALKPLSSSSSSTWLLHSQVLLDIA